jgi:hypothetical protein
MPTEDEAMFIRDVLKKVPADFMNNSGKIILDNSLH